MLRKIPTGAYILIILALIALNFYLYHLLFTERVLTVSVFEAGKGRAVILESPNGGTLLVNTGSDASILRILGTRLPPWQRRIDAVVLTGATATIVGGLPDVLERYEVSHLIRFGSSGSGSLENRLQEVVAKESGLKLAEPAPYGLRLILDGSVSVEVLPSSLKIIYGESLFTVGSTTENGKYQLDGFTVRKK
jgi:hypothetical protein